MFQFLEEMAIYEDEEAAMNQFYGELIWKLLILLTDREEIQPCEDIEENVHIVIEIKKATTNTIFKLH